MITSFSSVVTALMTCPSPTATRATSGIASTRTSPTCIWNRVSGHRGPDRPDSIDPALSMHSVLKACAHDFFVVVPEPRETAGPDPGPARGRGPAPDRPHARRWKAGGYSAD